MIKTPQQAADHIRNALWNSRKPLAFSFAWGLLAHMYMLVNKLPNHDDITSIGEYGSGYASGRWFLAMMGDAVKAVAGNYSLPWINGLLTILLLSISACIFTDIFEIRDSVECFLVCGIMVTFPTVTCMLNFMFTSYFYAAAVLLSLLSCRSVIRGEKEFFPGILGISCVCGIYQSFLLLTAGVLLTYLISECMDSKTSSRDIFTKGIKYLFALAAGTALYLILNKAALAVTQTSLTDYQSIDQMGKVSLPELISGIKKTYKTFLGMVFRDYLGITNIWFIRALLAGTLVFDAAAGIFWLSLKQPALKKLFFCVLALLYPAAVNGIYILSPGSPYIYALMFYSLALVWLLPLILWNAVRKNMERPPKNSAGHTASALAGWLLVICLAGSSLYFSRYANTVYLAMNMTYSQSLSYYTTLVTRIKSAPGYRPDLKVAYLGDVQDDTLYTGLPLFEGVTLAEGSRVIIGNYSWIAFVRKYLGFAPKQVKNVENLKKKKKVQQMPCYPADGSIRVIGNTVAVKFSE